MSDERMNDQANWTEANDRHLAATVRWIRLRLQRLVHADTDEAGSGAATDAIEQARQDMLELEKPDPPPAMLLLARALGLSGFDRQVLALCTAMELDTRIAGLCAQAQGDSNKPWPTFALAFALFDAPEWNALSPHAPLRYWRLLEINQPGAVPLTAAALTADERIVNYLKGINYLDDRLTSLLDPSGFQHADETLPPSQQRVVDNILERLNHSNATQGFPLIELTGHDANSKRLIAERIASMLGLNLQIMELKTLPEQPGDFETFTRLWERESILLPLALYIVIDADADSGKTRLRRFLQRNRSLAFIERDTAANELGRDRYSVEVSKPAPAEQAQLWSNALRDRAGDIPQRLAEQFSFSQSEINRLAELFTEDSAQNPPSLAGNLWQACRVTARTGMEQLARRVDARADREQLVLPAEQKALLQQITAQVAQRRRVYEDWGFRRRMNRGMGINALFAGESGTGKTMAAEVIANELGLDLYRIDLSSVVSKYIGETEKNLRRLFDTAEDSGAILFFDEADALFGKRSEVKDSHDRYANIEINYLLQRMESYRGLAILATNMKNALDRAFVRRLRFIVDFPFPGVEERTEIWRKIFPAETPLDAGIDCERLARLNLTGGNIHNVALNAAFLAARNGSHVTMSMLLSAARTEFRKLERPTKESDFDWQIKMEVAR